MTDPGIGPQKEALLDQLFEGTPSTLDEAAAELSAISNAFRSRAAQKLQPALNDRMKTQTPQSLDDYRELAHHVDHLTSRLGLCVQLEQKPALLSAEYAYPWQKQPRFIMLKPASSTSYVASNPSVKVPTLELMPKPDNAERLLQPLRDLEQKNKGRAF